MNTTPSTNSIEDRLGTVKQKIKNFLEIGEEEQLVTIKEIGVLSEDRYVPYNDKQALMRTIKALLINTAVSDTVRAAARKVDCDWNQQNPF